MAIQLCIIALECRFFIYTWHELVNTVLEARWRHQMETFSALLALCAGNSPVTGEFPSQRPVSQSFDILFHLRLKKRLSKQSRRRWFQTPLCSLWRHWNKITENLTVLDHQKQWSLQRHDDIIPWIRTTFRIASPLWGKPLATGVFPSDRASNANSRVASHFRDHDAYVTLLWWFTSFRRYVSVDINDFRGYLVTV